MVKDHDPQLARDDGSHVMQAHDHKACIDRVLADVEEISASQCLRLTPVRRRVLEILLEEHEAIGAYDVLKRLEADGMKAQPPIAYRALEFLQEHGFVHKIERLNAFVACMHPREDHTPAFMVCRLCRTVAETHSDEPQALMGEAAKELGFKIERTVLEVEGICPVCQQGDRA
ncbi:MAG: Fur family transcriptional regulator [Pseudomonadota bacterium]